MSDVLPDCAANDRKLINCMGTMVCAAKVRPRKEHALMINGMPSAKLFRMRADAILAGRRR